MDPRALAPPRGSHSARRARVWSDRQSVSARTGPLPAAAGGGRDPGPGPPPGPTLDPAPGPGPPPGPTLAPKQVPDLLRAQPWRRNRSATPPGDDPGAKTGRRPFPGDDLGAKTRSATFSGRRPWCRNEVGDLLRATTLGPRRGRRPSPGDDLGARGRSATSSGPRRWAEDIDHRAKPSVSPAAPTVAATTSAVKPKSSESTVSGPPTQW